MSRNITALLVISITLLLTQGCGSPGEGGDFEGAGNYPIYADQTIPQDGTDRLPTIVAEAEAAIEKPLKALKRNEEGYTVFRDFSTREELVSYLTRFMTDETADAAASEMIDEEKSRRGNCLAARPGYGGPNILHADPMSIKAVSRTEKETILQMDYQYEGRAGKMTYALSHPDRNGDVKIAGKKLEYNQE
ncbi:hypothetical protein [Alteribacter natronophilus]|uniref:hypothetical protein n=1 Tax=Alteribacter natronophilus TaxID=2583810 RepID=UPI00110EC812|nr:hypothetical protein [Alteribacter natronophilus]TMW71751.1 hypothetical protein FGB90_12045 [Alteribacter natronophilus]